MKLIPAVSGHIPELVRLSKAAFDSDIYTGADAPGGPPGYDDIFWHQEMLAGNHLYTAIENETIVGGAILFVDDNSPWHMYIGRIFIDPIHHRKGFGSKLMSLIEELSPAVTTYTLDTPAWNIRTNAFYTSLGYTEASHSDDEIRYQKRANIPQSVCFRKDNTE